MEVKEVFLKQVMTNSLSLAKCSTVFIPTMTLWKEGVWYCAVLGSGHSLLGGAHKGHKDVNATGRWLLNEAEHPSICTSRLCS